MNCTRSNCEHLPFRTWFKGSKVLDDQGRPLVMYHGTNAKFSTFDCEGGVENAAFFTPNRKLASRFAAWAYEGSGEGSPRVLRVFLSIKNPKVIHSNDVLDEYGGHSFVRMTRAVKLARQEGYDGIHLLEVHDMGITQDQWAAFAPRQIKLAFTTKVGAR